MCDGCERRERHVVVTERGDDELTAIAACMVALRDLDAAASARVVAYLADRHGATTDV